MNNTTAIRQKLHNYLEIVNDRKVKAIYTMMEEEIEEADFKYSVEFKNELNKRYESYKDGSAKMITPKESKKRIEKILKQVRKNDI